MGSCFLEFSQKVPALRLSAGVKIWILVCGMHRRKFSCPILIRESDLRNFLDLFRSLGYLGIWVSVSWDFPEFLPHYLCFSFCFLGFFALGLSVSRVDVPCGCRGDMRISPPVLWRFRTCSLTAFPNPYVGMGVRIWFYPVVLDPVPNEIISARSDVVVTRSLERARRRKEGHQFLQLF